VTQGLSLLKKIGITVVLSLLMGLFIIITREKMKPTVCHSLQLKRLGIGYLASIPDLNAVTTFVGKIRRQEPFGKGLLIDNFSSNDKRSLPFQFLRLKILHLFKGRPAGPKVICVVGCTPGRGKSLVASNMAASFAHYQIKTLIVDCDPHHVGQSEFFSSTGTVGFTDSIANELPTLHAAQKTKFQDLDFMPSGAKKQFSHTQFIKNLPKALKQMKSRYDLVILDAPDFFSNDQAIALSQNSDLVVVVAEAFRSEVSELANVTNALYLSEVKNVCGVINRAEDYFGLSHTSLDNIEEGQHRIQSIGKGA
jgi:MinD-like ATPase involved in chromosome partitioning or flagellar assembly